MSRLILLFILFISACSVVEPFVDRRREAGVQEPEKLYVGESKPEAPAVCFNAWTTDYSTVKRLADEECKKQETGRYAEPVKQTYFSCRLLVPNHLYFTCVK